MCKKANRNLCILYFSFPISPFTFPFFPFPISNFEFICGAALFCQLTALIAKPNEIGKYCSNFVIVPTLACRQLSQLMSGSFNKTKLPSQVQSLLAKKIYIAHTTRCTSSCVELRLGRVKCSLNTRKFVARCASPGGALPSVAAHYVYAVWHQWKYLLQQIAAA